MRGFKGKRPVERTVCGAHMNEYWSINAKHALAHKDGTWYNYLNRFPGVLFDTDGYVLFDTIKDYITCEQLVFKKKVRVIGGISSIPGYVAVKGKHVKNNTSSYKIRTGNRS